MNKKNTVINLMRKKLQLICEFYFFLKYFLPPVKLSTFLFFSPTLALISYWSCIDLLLIWYWSHDGAAFQVWAYWHQWAEGTKPLSDASNRRRARRQRTAAIPFEPPTNKTTPTVRNRSARSSNTGDVNGRPSAPPPNHWRVGGVPLTAID